MKEQIKILEESDPFLAEELIKIANGKHERVVGINNDIIILKPLKKKTIKRNDPCLCGSGKKFKKCCMRG